MPHKPNTSCPVARLVNGQPRRWACRHHPMADCNETFVEDNLVIHILIHPRCIYSKQPFSHSVPQTCPGNPLSLSTMVLVTRRWGTFLMVIYTYMLAQLISMHSSFAGNSEPSFVFPTVIATHQSGGSSASSSSAGGAGRAPPPIAGKPSHLASKRGIEDLDFFIGDEAVANSKFVKSCVSLKIVLM